jgi:hypothetical protein
MRLSLSLLLVSLVVACASHAPVAPASVSHQAIPDVNWVKVSGSTNAVSNEDMAQAVKAFRGVGLDEPALTVVGKDEIHAYGQNRDLGWYKAERAVSMSPDGAQHPDGWIASGQGLPADTEALECMWNADQVYVFPIATPLDPHRDDAHMRLVEGWARHQLVQLLGDADHWFVGFNSLMYSPRDKPGVGFLFKSDKHELMLFLIHSDMLVGTYDGEHISGTLGVGSDGKYERELQEWITKYAQPAPAPATTDSIK